MSKDLDWVDYFDQAYHNAVVYGTGFIRITANGPKGLEMSVVDPRDYKYIEPFPEKYVYGTPLLDAMKGDKNEL